MREFFFFFFFGRRVHFVPTTKQNGKGEGKRTEPFVMRGTFEVKDGGRRRRRKTSKNLSDRFCFIFLLFELLKFISIASPDD
jgi:hypothetical protein